MCFLSMAMLLLIDCMYGLWYGDGDGVYGPAGTGSTLHARAMPVYVMAVSIAAAMTVTLTEHVHCDVT